MFALVLKLLFFLWFQDENDVYILTKVSDILHSIFSSYREKVLPWFEQLLQLIVNLIVSELFQQRSELQLNSAFYKLSPRVVFLTVSTQTLGRQTVGSLHIR